MQSGVRPWYTRPLGIAGIVVAAPVAAWVLFFVWNLGQSIFLLRSGSLDPAADFKKKQFAATVSDVFANTQVTAEDLKRIEEGDHPSLGIADAKVTIVEFIDWDCPYCREVSPTVRGFLAANPNRVRIIVRDFPLSDIHPQARDAAIAARCVYQVGGNDLFWMYHDRLFTTQGSHASADLRRYADAIGVDLSRYDGCIENPRTVSSVDASISDGQRAGVGATPTFFFNGTRIPGAIDPESFEVIVRAAETVTTKQP